MISHVTTCDPNPYLLFTQEEIPEGLAALVEVAAEMAPMPVAPPKFASVEELMAAYDSAWDATKKDFQFKLDDFNLENFIARLEAHVAQFSKKEINSITHFGFIEKFDLDMSDNPLIFVRADLHGDLKSLIENLRSLQMEGMLDEHYRCRPGAHLAFLGDYCDRGLYGTQILEMLMALKEENRGQVHLIRGNHEYLWVNLSYGFSDDRLMQVIGVWEANQGLTNFYETMSLTTYFSIKAMTCQEYIACSHGTLEPSMDTDPLFKQRTPEAFIPVPKKRTLSERIHKIANDNSSPWVSSAKRVVEIVDSSENMDPFFSLTAYNWGDVNAIGESVLGALGERKYCLNGRDIRHCLNLCSEEHRVMMLFRGHQHGFRHIFAGDQLVTTTLPVGIDVPYYFKDFPGQEDRAYILNLVTQEKKAILRPSGYERTDYITAFHPLTSAFV